MDDIVGEIRRAADKAALSPELALAVVAVESGFNPKARSRTSTALGLFQFIRSTREAFGVYDDDRYLADYRLQIRLGVKHLANLRSRFSGSYVDALLAYHVGAEAVQSGRFPREAFSYVDRVLEAMEHTMPRPQERSWRG